MEKLWRQLVDLNSEESRRNLIPWGWEGGYGSSMPLEALTPKYDAAHHELYVNLISRAIQHRDVYSVALMGPYGSGKSSIFQELRRRRENWRIIELALSTLDPRLVSTRFTGNPAESSVTNQIQKEIVKQLLYRLEPWKTQQSRFRRATKLSWRGAIKVSILTVILLFLAYALSVLAGWYHFLLQRIEQANWDAFWFFALVLGGCIFLGLYIWQVTAGRYKLKADLKASPLSLSLEPNSTSYFDQYLDEIMYFFQVSKTEVVLIEDIDRFESAAVFDTLRSLNTLVNHSSQVKQKVVFLYAIRDSVLGEIGTERENTKANQEDDRKKEVSFQENDVTNDANRSNRTKYFDVIIPVVPFVTTDNARDLMLQVLREHVADSPDSPGISPALVRLAARYVADMRTLRSIRNEYEVYKDRLLTSPTYSAPGINEDIIFSLVLVRVSSPAAYEAIRLSSSPFDCLYTRWRELIDRHLAIQAQKLTSFRTQLEHGVSLPRRVKQAAARLEGLRAHFASLLTNGPVARVRYMSPLADDDLEDIQAWRKIANGEPLEIQLLRSNNSQLGRLKFEKPLLERLLGMTVDVDSWRNSDLEALEADIRSTQHEIAFLRHHTWMQIYQMEDVTLPAQDNELLEVEPQERKNDEAAEVSFQQLVAAYAPSDLTRDLIANGYFTHRFARYSSMFYGKTVSLNAEEYIHRAIESGRPMIEFNLSTRDVEQLLIEQDATTDDAELFDDVSIYNLDILDYLLFHREAAAQRVATHLAKRWGALEKELVQRFYQQMDKDQAAKLATLMTPYWNASVSYNILEANVSPDTRLCIVNNVMGSVVDAKAIENLNQSVGTYLSEHYARIENIISPKTSSTAEQVMYIMYLSGGIIKDLSLLNDQAREAAIELSIYPVSQSNMRVLAESHSIALDDLLQSARRETVYKHLIKHLDDYLDALEREDLTDKGPIADPNNFRSVLNSLSAVAESSSIDRFVKVTSYDCHVSDLEHVDSSAWSALLRYQRIDPNIPNIERYIDEFGIDEFLFNLLSNTDEIPDLAEADTSAKLRVATQLLSARGLIVSAKDRVTLAALFEPGFIPLQSLSSRDGPLIGLLLRQRLLEDSHETFTAGLLNSWQDLEQAIVASKSFGDWVGPEVLPPEHLASFLNSSAISDDKKSQAICELKTFLDESAEVPADEIAQVLIDRQDKVSPESLIALQRLEIAPTLLRKLIVAQGKSLSVLALRTLLFYMGDSYRKVAEGGRGKARFEINPENESILQRLEDITHTGIKYENKKSLSTLVVYLRLAEPLVFD